jgi:hypothetical protein
MDKFNRIRRATMLPDTALDIAGSQLTEHCANACGIFGGKVDKVGVLVTGRAGPASQRGVWSRCVGGHGAVLTKTTCLETHRPESIMACTISGNATPAGARTQKSTSSSKSVGLGFTCTVTVPGELGQREVRNVEVLPQARQLIPECGNAAFRRGACTGQDQNAS